MFPFWWKGICIQQTQIRPVLNMNIPVHEWHAYAKHTRNTVPTVCVTTLPLNGVNTPYKYNNKPNAHAWVRLELEPAVPLGRSHTTWTWWGCVVHDTTGHNPFTDMPSSCCQCVGVVIVGGHTTATTMTTRPPTTTTTTTSSCRAHSSE